MRIAAHLLDDRHTGAMERQPREVLDAMNATSGLPPLPARQTRARLALRVVATAAVVVVIFVGVLPRIANYSDVWATISDMTWLEVVTLLMVTVWNVVTYWFVLVAALPGLRYGQAAVANQASTAIANTVPAGAALGVGVTFAMYRSWGFSRVAVTRSVVVSGIWINFVKLGLPVVALALLAIEGDVSVALVVASLIGVAALVASVVVFAMLLSSDRMARSIGTAAGRLVSRPLARLGRRPVTSWGPAVARFRADTIDLVGSRWLALTVTSVISQLSLAAVLLTTLRHVGLDQETLSWITVLASFAFVRLISALPITPGGVGVVELGYVAALTIGLDEGQQVRVVAAVLVFRFLTYFLPIPVGAIAYVYWRANRSWRRVPPDRRTAPDLDSGTPGSEQGHPR